MYDAGGNQRDVDRAKAAKKQAALNKSKTKESNTSLAKRKEAYVSLFYYSTRRPDLFLAAMQKF
jgi:hypothetical protein